VAAAVAAFSERGYHNASMDEIAAAAGISKPAVYAHFGSKDELYVECVARAAERFHRALEEAVRPVERPEARLWTGILTLLDHVDRERAEWTMLFAGVSGTEPVAREAARIRGETQALIAALFTETATRAGVGGSALEAMGPLGVGFVGTSEALARWWLEHPETPKENVAMYLMNYVWSGLGGLIEGRLWVPPE
jgi:AcrR family transcriptional regulator